jgi:hypothetical protein
MTIFKILCPHRRRLSLVAFCLLLGWSPLSAQTGKELMADACYNELHQREQNALWASHLQRRTADHVYLEEEIETVEGPIHRLISVDGHEPSPSERKQNDDRLRDLMQNPKARLAAKKNREADEKKFGELLRVMPDVFLYEDQGNHGGIQKLGFHPNPAFAPKTYEEITLHAMSGFVLIDLDEKRIAHLSGTLTQQVDFGFGVIGQLTKGGTIEVNRIRLSPGIWKTNSSKIDINGRIALLKTISKRQDETYSEFKRVAPDTNIAQALQQIAGKSGS